MLLDSKTRALIRRHGPFEVAGAYQWADQTISILEKSGQLKFERNRIVELAQLVAEVRTESTARLGQLLKTAKVSEKHVRRLLAADREDVVDQLATIVRLTKKTANSFDLVRIAYFWGDSTRRRIAIDYFGATQNDEQDDTPVTAVGA